MPTSFSHPGLQLLKDSIVNNGATHCVGTTAIPPDFGVVFYQTEQDSDSARRIDLANASAPALQQLMDASLGRNDEDVLDESHPNPSGHAGNLDLSRFLCKFEVLEKIHAHVAMELLDGDVEPSLRAELYKLNVYEKGGFSKARKDTPNDNPFASLVVIFPTPHEGGSLLLRGGDCEEYYIYDSSQELASSTPASPSVGYIAFSSDVEHEVMPVTSGYCVMLTYNLYLDDKPPALAAFESDIVPSPVDVGYRYRYRAIKASLRELLSDSSFLPSGGRLGFGLSHHYPYAHTYSKWHSLPNNVIFEAQIKALKGADGALRRACMDLGLTVSMRVLYSDNDKGRRFLVPHSEHHVWSTLNNHINPPSQLPSTLRVTRAWPRPPRLEPAGRVEWVIDVGSTNTVRIESRPSYGYGARASSKSQASFYVDLVLIVEIGDAEDREI